MNYSVKQNIFIKYEFPPKYEITFLLLPADNTLLDVYSCDQLIRVCSSQQDELRRLRLLRKWSYTRNKLPPALRTRESLPDTFMKRLKTFLLIDTVGWQRVCGFGDFVFYKWILRGKRKKHEAVFTLESAEAGDTGSAVRRNGRLRVWRTADEDDVLRSVDGIAAADNVETAEECEKLATTKIQQSDFQQTFLFLAVLTLDLNTNARQTYQVKCSAKAVIVQLKSNNRPTICYRRKNDLDLIP